MLGLSLHQLPPQRIMASIWVSLVVLLFLGYENPCTIWVVLKAFVVRVCG